MNDGIPFFDWMIKYIGVIVPTVVAIVGGLFALAARYRKSVAADLQESKDETKESIKESNQHYELEVAKLWAQLREILAMQSTHTSNIAVLDVEQKNTWKQLEDIKDMVKNTNGKIDDLFNIIVKRARGES